MSFSDDWFVSWFGSPYYPILYRHRDESEAFRFISVLLRDLSLPVGAAVLDLACGRGRHARILHDSGLNVYGFDIAAERIAEAKQMENDRLHFFVHDMRDPFPHSGFDVIFNLFTSFGYFGDLSENLGVLQNVNDSLVKGGLFVLDYLNVDWVLNRLVPEEDSEIEGVRFKIRRTLEAGHIHKEIRVQDGNAHFTFHEWVSAFTLSDFERMLGQTGFRIQKLWGDYQGNPYHKETSQRLILFCTK
jgi:SAM-dependent methyltransferase